MTPAGDEAERIDPDAIATHLHSVDTTERIVWSFDVLEINGAGGI